MLTNLSLSPSLPLSLSHTRNHKSRMCMYMYTYIHTIVLLVLLFPVFIVYLFCFVFANISHVFFLFPLRQTKTRTMTFSLSSTNVTWTDGVQYFSVEWSDLKFTYIFYFWWHGSYFSRVWLAWKFFALLTIYSVVRVSGVQTSSSQQLPDLFTVIALNMSLNQMQVKLSSPLTGSLCVLCCTFALVGAILRFFLQKNCIRLCFQLCLVKPDLSNPGSFLTFSTLAQGNHIPWVTNNAIILTLAAVVCFLYDLVYNVIVH